ncbi:hypothetical protein NQZ68_034355 [Dissostichus eleginoides]|nr:hypothetical protein NQZ68_034355 [Dissostichus eleginoides]
MTCGNYSFTHWEYDTTYLRTFSSLDSVDEIAERLFFCHGLKKTQRFYKVMKDFHALWTCFITLRLGTCAVSDS